MAIQNGKVKTKLQNKTKEKNESDKTMGELFYKKVIRIAEYYVILCFIIIVNVPLLQYAWVGPFMKFIYFTGFPLLILLILISLVKDPLIEFLNKFLEKR